MENKTLKQLSIAILVAICSAIVAFFSSSCALASITALFTTTARHFVKAWSKERRVVTCVTLYGNRI